MVNWADDSLIRSQKGEGRVIGGLGKSGEGQGEKAGKRGKFTLLR